MTRTLFVITILLGFVACSTTIPNTEATQKMEEERKYPIVIAFGSIGTGVPDAKPLEEFVVKFKKDNKVKALSADKIGPLGREGEYKICFLLSELYDNQKTKFIDSLKEVVTKLNDRGYATLNFDEVIDRETLGSRATIEPIKY